MSKMSVIKDAANEAFEAESDRTEYQLSKAEKLVAGVVAAMGFQLFDFKSLVKIPRKGSC